MVYCSLSCGWVEIKFNILFFIFVGCILLRYLRILYEHIIYTIYIYVIRNRNSFYSSITSLQSFATVPHTTQLLTSLSMSHTSQDCQVECLCRELALHFTVCLVRTSSADVNSTVMWWCILPKKTCDLESLVENVGLHSVITPKMFFRDRFSCPWHTHCVSHSLHLIVHIWQNSDIRSHKHNQDSFRFSMDFNFLSGNSLDANN
jgi:hypothetical protein